MEQIADIDEVVAQETPILTIAIPTYNRKVDLARSLDSVLGQLTPLVEVLVSDNASTDGTELLVQEYLRRTPQMIYYRNQENLGLDGNFLNCYSKARGKYILLLGDDDILLPGALAHILRELRKNPIFVHLNTCLLAEPGSSVCLSPRLEEGAPLVFANKNEALRIIGVYITFVSSLIVRKDLVDVIPDKERFVGTFFLHSHIALETMRTGGKSIIITKCCIAETPNRHVAYDLYEVWGNQYYRLLHETAIECGFDEEVVGDVYRESIMTTILSFAASFRSCSGKWNSKALLDSLNGYAYLKPIYWLSMKLPRKLSRPFSARISRFLRNRN